MDHSIIPAPWKKFLSTIQTLYPSAIIAGGALRDTIVENPIKDVDIFIKDQVTFTEFSTGPTIDINDIANLFGIKVLDKDEKSPFDYVKLSHNIKEFKEMARDLYLNDDSQSVNMESFGKKSLLESYITLIFDVQYNGVLYQLIFVEQDPIKMVYNDFDFGICKLYFDGNQLVVTDDFWYDFENKQLTVSGKFSMGQIIHTLFVHRPNIMKKFPNWKIVIDDITKKTFEEMPPSYQELNLGDRVDPETGYVMGLDEWKEHCRNEMEKALIISTSNKPPASTAPTPAKQSSTLEQLLKTLDATQAMNPSLPPPFQAVLTIQDLPTFVPTGDGTSIYVVESNTIYTRSQGQWIADPRSLTSNRSSLDPQTYCPSSTALS